MKLNTCSYYAWRPEQGAGVRITLGLPRRRLDVSSWPHVWALTPRGWYWQRPDFHERFIEQLDRYGVAGIREALGQAAQQTGSDRLVLCCFERQISMPDDCHRRTFAQWWYRRTGDVVPELDPNPHAPLIEQWHADRIVHTGPATYEITSVEDEEE